MSTAHNQAQSGQIAKTVLMPGDPLRAEYIANEYLTDVVCFNQVRNMLGFTGNYKGQSVSVMGSGMGMPSIGIYSHELYCDYGVENIIRIGSAGALSDEIHVMDVVMAMGACTDSNYASTYHLPGTFAPIADYKLLSTAVNIARIQKVNPQVGNILSSDIFYNDDPTVNDQWKKMNVLAVDMEAAALYMNAARLGKRALTILTISDHLYTGEKLSAKDRQTSFSQMMEIALETAVQMEK
ncbi:MAG: purine-nucleoside phosphorylase [Lachnospira sp.]|nr:purine-nucleoside phosphorylase [Lachnospira sp.]